MNRIETEVVATLSRVSGGDEDESWRLRITDRRSRVEVLELRMDNDTFADFMSSREASRVAKAEIVTGPPAQNWGKYAHHASELIDTRDMDYKTLDEELKKEGVLRARDMRRDTGKPWQFVRYYGGGGGSPFRTMHFVYYSDKEEG